MLLDSHTHSLMYCQLSYCILALNNWDRDLMAHKAICYLPLYREKKKKANPELESCTVLTDKKKK